MSIGETLSLMAHTIPSGDNGEKDYTREWVIMRKGTEEVVDRFTARLKEAWVTLTEEYGAEFIMREVRDCQW